MYIIIITLFHRACAAAAILPLWLRRLGSVNHLIIFGYLYIERNSLIN